jgi:NADPH:quinone reductase-like Zn-dependent oxidoreductase
MNGMQAQLGATFARYVPAPFIGPECLARMREVAAALPAEASTFLGFECRLGAAPAEADLAICIGRDDAAHLARALALAPPGAEPVWQRLAAFCRDWVAADEAGITNTWLEFDLAGSRAGDPMPVPSLFLGMREGLEPGEDARIAATEAVLDRLSGDGRAATLRHAVAALPQGGRLFQIGVMLARPDPGLRLCASGLDASAIGRFLDRLGCADPDGTRSALIESLSPLAAELRLGLDAQGAAVAPRLGIEIHPGHDEAAAGRWQAICAMLLDRGLAKPDQIQAIGQWMGLQHSRLLKADWPAALDAHPARRPGAPAGAMWRSLNHVKLSVEPGRPLAAKAYLATRLVWPEEAAMRALLPTPSRNGPTREATPGMRALAIIGRDHPAATAAGRFTMGGVEVRADVLTGLEEPAFDPVAQPDHVRLRILGFSMNYRDRALVLRMATSRLTQGYYLVGSDFVAEVEAVGSAVRDLAPGDRVIPDCRWPMPGGGLPGGIPSNHASREVQVLHRQSLMRIPPGMDPAIAASFSIGAQTANSMLRRLALRPGQQLLLTAPRSNTSLFVLAALAGSGVLVDGLSSSGRDEERLRALGLQRLMRLDGKRIVGGPPAPGGYDAVIDPFYDLYLPHVIPLMGFGARYLTCGMEDQSSHLTGGTPRRQGAVQALMAHIITRNLSIEGNCIGTSDDLARAVERHDAGGLPVAIDSTFRADPAGFLRRTYLDPDRFGKVVFLYDRA